VSDEDVHLFDGLSPVICQPPFAQLQRLAQRRRRRRAMSAGLAAATVVALVAAGGAVLATRIAPAHTPAATGPPTKGSNHQAGGYRLKVIGRWHIPTGVFAVASANGSAWVVSSGKVYRFDQATRRIAAVIRTPGTNELAGVTTTPGVIWVSTGVQVGRHPHGRVYAISTRTNRLLGHGDFEGQTFGLLATSKNVWVLVGDRDVSRLQAVNSSGQPVASAVSPPIYGVSGGAVSAHRLWVVTAGQSTGGTLDWSDPARVPLEIHQARLPVAPASSCSNPGPTGIATNGRGVWLACGSIYQLTSNAHSTVRAISVPRVANVAVNGIGLWVTNDAPSSSSGTYEPHSKSPGRLYLISTSSGRQLARSVGLGLSPTYLTVSGTRAWVLDFTGDMVFEVAASGGTSSVRQ
jgi:hypothetical protein